MLENEWQCSKCELTGTLSSIEKLQHSVICKESKTTEDTSKSTNAQPKKKNSKAYECPDCQKTLYLTPIEILKHKKTHSMT